jgi:hypothetical protein
MLPSPLAGPRHSPLSEDRGGRPRVFALIEHWDGSTWHVDAPVPPQ